MAIKYVCDICGKAYNVTRPAGFTQAGFDYPMPAPEGWGAMSIMGPREKPKLGKPAMINPPWVSLVCSQACVEKALDEARKYLRQAFEKASD